MNIALLQSFRTFDVPEWVNICQASIRNLASENGWTYKFKGDEFFEYAPQWAKDTVKDNNLCTISDICRLEWIKEELNEFDVVIWADIDMLILDKNHISLDLSQPYGFSYELAFDSESNPIHGINNAFMFFSRSSPMLGEYLNKAYAALKMASKDVAIDRTIIGPSLLRSFSVPNTNIIYGFNILNFYALLRICKDPQGGIPDYILSNSAHPIGGANLCLNERSFFIGEQRPQYDHILYVAANTLLNLKT